LILRVALDTPLRRVFDYLPPTQPGAGVEFAPRPGVRVRVPFGRRQLIGILVGTADDSRIPAEKLKPIVEIIDQEPVFDHVTFELLRWAADYYHHPIGEVFAAALPASLREGQATQQQTQVWVLTAAAARSSRHPQIAARRASAHCCNGSLSEVRRRSTKLARISRLIKYVQPGCSRLDYGRAEHGARIRWPYGLCPERRVSTDEGANGSRRPQSSKRCRDLQRICCMASPAAARPRCTCGSSPRAIAGGGQALVLVPEIALTPQLVDRFRAASARASRCCTRGSPAQRRDAWRAAQRPGAHRDRHALGRVHLPATARADRRRRGARRFVQAARGISLLGARSRGAARAARAVPIVWARRRRRSRRSRTSRGALLAHLAAAARRARRSAAA
jgi:primosomal protein N' (replication factor Y) (superfamily II helicase)